MARQIRWPIVLLALFVASCAFFFPFRASIDSGERFGVRIGMPMAQAREIMLQRGLRADDRPNWMPRECGTRKAGPNDEIQDFSDPSLQDEDRWYCILGVNGRVAVIGWGDTSL